MKAIFKRELMAYFTSPIGYVFIGVFAFISGIYFNQYIITGGSNEIVGAMSDSLLVLVLLVPVLTMRLIAEERSSRTDQLLLSAPVGVWSIVLGKLGAAMCVYIGAMVTTFPYVIIVAVHSSPVWGEIIAAYLGFFLLGLSFISIGLFFSSITESQIIALVVTIGVLLASFLLSRIPSTGLGLLDAVLDLMMITVHFSNLLVGVFRPENLVYYLSLSAMFVFFTVRSVEKRRWN